MAGPGAFNLQFHSSGAWQQQQSQSPGFHQQPTTQELWQQQQRRSSCGAVPASQDVWAQTHHQRRSSCGPGTMATELWQQAQLQPRRNSVGSPAMAFMPDPNSYAQAGWPSPMLTAAGQAHSLPLSHHHPAAFQALSAWATPSQQVPFNHPHGFHGMGGHHRAGAPSTFADQKHDVMHQVDDSVAKAVFLGELGITAEEKEDFEWIADYGLQADAMPPGCALHFDVQSGRMYYVDSETQASSWENPLTAHLKRVVEAGRQYLQDPREGFFDEWQRSLWEMHRDDMETWTGPLVDEVGRAYYANSSTGASSWRDPREDAQYFFEMESNLVASLAEVLPPPEVKAVDQYRLPNFGGGCGFSNSDNSSAQKVTLPGGAEVLTLEGESRSPSRPERRRLSCDVQAMAQESATIDRGHAMRNMGRSTEWLYEASQAEEECQRRAIRKKVELRKLRLLRMAAPATMASSGRSLPRLNSEATLARRLSERAGMPGVISETAAAAAAAAAAVAAAGDVDVDSPKLGELVAAAFRELSLSSCDGGPSVADEAGTTGTTALFPVASVDTPASTIASGLYDATNAVSV